MRAPFDFKHKSGYNERGILVLHGERLLDGFMLLCLLFAAGLLVTTALELSAASSQAGDYPRCLVIDPGHGGIDGGAVAFNGVRESDINLAIGLKLCDLAHFYGIPVLMTRTDDSSRTSLADYSEHEDLVYRAELANRVERAVLVSIHQNFFPTSQPSGAQVLYAPDEQSRSFGETLQALLVQSLQPTNRRLAEPAPRSLYLTAHVNCPAVLVECGFLSNLSDLDLLGQDSFQSSLALVLLTAYVRSFQQTTTISF